VATILERWPIYDLQQIAIYKSKGRSWKKTHKRLLKVAKEKGYPTVSERRMRDTLYLICGKNPQPKQIQIQRPKKKSPNRGIVESKKRDPKPKVESAMKEKLDGRKLRDIEFIDKERLQVYAIAKDKLINLYQTGDDPKTMLEECRKILADADDALGRGKPHTHVEVNIIEIRQEARIEIFKEIMPLLDEENKRRIDRHFSK